MCKISCNFVVVGTVCPDVRGMCQRPGVRTDLHMFVVWATAGLLGATCGVDLDRPILGEPTLFVRSCFYQLLVLLLIASLPTLKIFKV